MKKRNLTAADFNIIININRLNLVNSRKEFITLLMKGTKITDVILQDLEEIL